MTQRSGPAAGGVGRVGVSGRFLFLSQLALLPDPGERKLVLAKQLPRKYKEIFSWWRRLESGALRRGVTSQHISDGFFSKPRVSVFCFFF